uniref:Protein aurora borealis n=1 Tax=Meloidogyne incognita TaxID=6306 RepID=A0A914LM11_MELIC
MNGTTSNSIVNGVSTFKEEKDSDEGIGKSEPHTNAFKRHKIHLSPKDDKDIGSSQTPPSNGTSSVFVTPGIYKRKICKPRIKESTEEVKFTWSVDELAIFRPVNFDEAEFSLPPDDWNPNPNYDVEKFWSRNTQIFPSPDIQNVFRPVGENYTKSSSSSSPNCYSYSSEDFYLSKSHGQNSTESSSSRSTSNKRFIHSSDNSPDDALLFKNLQLDNIKDEKENEHEFEQIEHSLSIGDDADRIFADLEHESGSFVMRQQVDSPIENVEKLLFFETSPIKPNS